MKRYVISVLLVMVAATSYCQTYRTLSGFDPTTGRSGYKYYDTMISLPYTTLKYVTGYGTFGSLTDTVRGLLSATSPIFYNSSTGVISSQAATSGQNGYLTSTDWSTFNGKQAALSGTGIVKSTAGTISYLTDPLPATNGGTGTATVTTGDLLYGSASNVWSKLAAGTSTYVLTSNGAGVAPSWQAAGGGSGWSLTGNSGLTAGTNFLGTTDNVALVFKMKSVVSGWIDSLTTTNGKNTFGFGSGLASTLGITAIGYKTAPLVTGADNTAVGNLAMLLTTTSIKNSAFGTGAMGNFATLAASDENVAVGYRALYNVQGGTSTGIGSQALLSQQYGIANTAVGRLALGSITTSSASNTAIGETAGYQYTGANALTASNNSIFVGRATLAKANSSQYEYVLGTGATGHGNFTFTAGASNQTDAFIIGKTHITPANIASPDTTAMLDVISTTKGFLPPRMTTTQRTTITTGIATANRVGGTGYTNGTYTANALTGGTGTGATATLTIAGGIVTVATFVNKGNGYTIGDVLTGSSIGAGTGFTLTVTANTAATEGLQVYDLTLHKSYEWDGTAWQPMR